MGVKVNASVGVTKETLDAIKRIAQKTGEMQYRLVERLVVSELKRIKTDQREKAA